MNQFEFMVAWHLIL